MQIISTRAVLTFGDGLGGRASFSISRANPNTTTNTATQAMLKMIDSGALRLNNLDSVEVIKSAKIIETSRVQVV